MPSRAVVDDRLCRYHVLAHLSTFGEKFGERLLSAVDPARWVVYGDPTDRAREVLDGFGAVYVEPLAGFAR
jgi:hypothetical protein